MAIQTLRKERETRDRGRTGEKELVEALIGDILIDEELVIAMGAVTVEIDDVLVLNAREKLGFIAELLRTLP